MMWDEVEAEVNGEQEDLGVTMVRWTTSSDGDSARGLMLCVVRHYGYIKVWFMFVFILSHFLLPGSLI